MSVIFFLVLFMYLFIHCFEKMFLMISNKHQVKKKVSNLVGLLTSKEVRGQM